MPSNPPDLFHNTKHLHIFTTIYVHFCIYTFAFRLIDLLNILWPSGTNYTTYMHDMLLFRLYATLCVVYAVFVLLLSSKFNMFYTRIFLLLQNCTMALAFILTIPTKHKQLLTQTLTQQWNLIIRLLCELNFKGNVLCCRKAALLEHSYVFEFDCVGTRVYRAGGISNSLQSTARA